MSHTSLPMPPPVPRRHPSRPSLSGSFDSTSPSADMSSWSGALINGSTSSTSLDFPESPSASARPAHPPSAIFVAGNFPTARPGSPSMVPVSPGIKRLAGPGTVGLGSPRIDFKEWVTTGLDGASSSSVLDSGEEISRPQDTIYHSTNMSQIASSSQLRRSPRETGLVDKESGLPSPPGTESDVVVTGLQKSPNPTEVSPLPQTLRHNMTPRRPQLNSPSHASPISSHRVSSPLNANTRLRISSGNSSASISSPTSVSRSKSTPLTPRHPSSELVNRSNTSLSGGSRASSLSQRAQNLSPSNSQRRGSGAKAPEFTERDYEESKSSPSSSIGRVPHRAKQISELRTSQSEVDGEPDESENEQRHDNQSDFDERIRLAEKKIAESISWKPRQATETPFKYSRNDDALQKSEAPMISTPGDGALASGKRRPLPADFRSGSLFSPIAHKANAEASIVRSARSGLVDIANPSSHSPVHSPLRNKVNNPGTEEVYDPTSPRSVRSQNTARPVANFGAPRRLGTGPSSTSRQDLNTLGLPRPRDLQARPRPESVFGTPVDSWRYSRGQDTFLPERSRLGTFRSDRDLASTLRTRSRVGLTPNDSVSAVASRSEMGEVRKDPLEVLRRLEERRSQHNRRWEEDRAASVLGYAASRVGDYDSPRSTTSHRHNAHLRRSATSMSLSRDTFSRSDHRRLGSDASMLFSARESPSLGRANEAIIRRSMGTSSEPRPRRSTTSLGRAQSDLNPVSTVHGSILIEAARTLETRIADNYDPSLIAACLDAAHNAESTNSGIHAALAMASLLEIDLEVDDGPTEICGQMRHLVDNLRATGRTSDHAVRDLTEAFLALARNPGGLNGATPARMLQRAETFISPRIKSDRRWSTDTPIRNQSTIRPSPSLLNAHSPLARYSRDATNAEIAQSGSVSQGGMHEQRTLEPIEQSPPRRMNPLTNSVTSPRSRSLTPPPLSPVYSPNSTQSHTLRKRTSMASTHTVRTNSFLPAPPREPTTAISAVTAGEVTSLSPTPLARVESPHSRHSRVSDDIPSPKDSVSGGDSSRRVIQSISDAYGNRSSPVAVGSWGSIDGTPRTSVSERFRKHLSRD